MRNLLQPLLRPAPLFILFSYLALSLVPFTPLLLGTPLAQPWLLAGVELAAWAAAWALFQRPAYFHWLLLPAFLALPTEIYLFAFYGQGISTHHLGILLESSPREAMEFLGQKVWTMGVVMLLVIAWWALTYMAACRTRALDWRGPVRWVALGIVLAGALVAAYGYEFGAQAAPPAASATAPAASKSAPASASASASASADNGSASDSAPEEPPAARPLPAASNTGWQFAPLPHWLRMPLAGKALAESWPFGLGMRAYDFYKERRYLAELNERSAAFTFHASQPEPDQLPEVVVMVIGESSRFDRWSLNGYTRETNPLLSKEANLVSLRDVVSAVSATRLSVPVILSRKPATQSLKDGFSEKSFLTAYKEAGFKTWWLSNQISFGKYDTPVSVFAKEANVVQFMNLGGFDNRSNFDEILFEPLKLALSDPAPKKLIVLHTLGSHWNYSQRHPKAFDKWQPSLFGVDKPVYTDLAIKPQLNNSYDNSILYTDWFLSQVIGTLKQAAPLSSLMYVADHGQTLYDGACRIAFHGHNTDYEFHVPAFMWYSDDYQVRYPEKVDQLKRHRKARLATENIFHTMLDMADIRYPGDKLEWSFLSPEFKRHKRYVDSHGWANYDNATFKGDCREVIDRDKAKPGASR